MATDSYLPTTDGGLLKWHTNFAHKLPNHADNLGLTKAQTDAVNADLVALGYGIQFVEALATAYHSSVLYKKRVIKGPQTGAVVVYPEFKGPVLPLVTVDDGITVRIGILVGQIKLNKNYKETIGIDLGIIGTVVSTDFSEYKPDLKVSLNVGFPMLKYTRKQAEGLKIYCRRGTETSLTYLGTATKSNFLDSRPNQVSGVPEIRDYQTWYIDKDVIVGIISNVVSITLTTI